jgi:hypothetical protein
MNRRFCSIAGSKRDRDLAVTFLRKRATYYGAESFAKWNFRKRLVTAKLRAGSTMTLVTALDIVVLFPLGERNAEDWYG